MSELSVPESGHRPDEEPTAETPLWEYLHVLLQRRWLILSIFTVVTTQAVVRTNLVQPVYRGVAQLLIERQAPSVLAFKEVTEVNAGWWGEEYFQTQYRVLQSRTLARRVIEDMKLYDEPEFGGPRTPEQVKAMLAAAPGESPAMEGLISSFIGRVSINPIKESRVVAVGVDAFRPELAARLANRLCRLYMQQNLDFRYQTSADAGEWLGAQVDDQRKKVEAAELALEKVREDGGIVSIDERRTLLNQKLTQLGSALTEIKTQRIEKQTLFEQMRRSAQPEDLPEVTKSPLVQAQLLDLANLERRESQLLETYLDQHPEVIQVRSQIRDAKEKLRAASARVVRGAESDYQAAASQEANISAALEATKAELVELERRAIPWRATRRRMSARSSSRRTSASSTRRFFPGPPSAPRRCATS
jgi:polysaccharide biosynthesis transport protein